MNTRPVRLRLDVLSTPYRGCELCTHGLTVNLQRYCACDVVVQPARTAPVYIARAPTGQCGPEARYLAFPGLTN